MSSSCYIAPNRHVTLLLIYISIAICFAQRVVLNLAIVDMTENVPTNVPCTMKHKIKEVGGVKLPWNQFHQSIILLAIYPAWTIMYIPVQIFCKKYGGRCPIIMGIVITTSGTGLIPVVATYSHWTFVALLRGIMGLGQALVFAATTDLSTKWVSLDSRVNFNRLRFISSIFGIIVGTLLTGVILNITLNWVYAFYFWCIWGSVWVLFAFVLIYNHPTLSPYIPSNELEDILRDQNSYQLRPLENRLIFKDMAIWALVAAQFGSNYFFYSLFTNMSKHMKEAIKLNSKENCLASTVPYFAILLGYLISTQISIKLIKKNVNVSLIFKIYIFLGTVVPSSMLVVLRIEVCDKYFIGSVFAAALFFNGTCQFVIDEGCMMRTIYNHDFLYAIVISFGSIPATLTPYIIGKIAEHNTVEAWSWISNIMCFVCGTCCLVFLIFGSGRRAGWDFSETDLWNVPPERNKKWYLQNA